MGDEQSPKPEEADDIGAACDQAEHGREQLKAHPPTWHHDTQVGQVGRV
jgi:hypothetical protein